MSKLIGRLTQDFEDYQDEEDLPRKQEREKDRRKESLDFFPLDIAT